MSAISKNILPVRMDWSTLRVVDLIEQMRMSAGTLSPTTKLEREEKPIQMNMRRTNTNIKPKIMLLKIVTNHLKLINYIKRFRENTLQSMHIRNKTDSSSYLWAIMRSYIGNRHFSLEAITSWPQEETVSEPSLLLHPQIPVKTHYK